MAVRPLHILPVGCLLILAACERAAKPTVQQPEPAAYLFAWAGSHQAQEGRPNFLAVIDVDPVSPTYGELVSTAPLGSGGGMPHHSEPEMPPSGRALFANAYHAGQTWLFDLSDPLRPVAVRQVDVVPGYHTPHSFLRLPDGSVLATMQYSDAEGDARPGGLARFAPDGRLITVSSSADPAFPGERIRTYALDASAGIDRVVTTSTPMDDERTADVVQVWRTSDLTLLKTLRVPEVAGDTVHHYPFEVKFLGDGRTALMNTYYCGFYLLTGLDTPNPAMEHVFTLEQPKYTACGVPVVLGDYWIMPVTAAREVVVLNVADPRAPRVVSRLGGDSTFVPHWAARDRGSDRVVLVSHADEDPRVLIARFDSATGTLTWDESFSDAATGRLGFVFDRAQWPHGASGKAMPHGVVFGGGRSTLR